MKKIVVAMILVLSLCLFGCGEKNTSINMEDLAQELMEQLPFTDELAEIKENVIYHLYALDSEKIEEIKVYLSSGATAEEIAIIKSDDVSAVEEAVKKRVESKKKDFEGYLPEELEKLEDPVIITRGNYVILCITSDSELARKIITNY